MKVLGHEVEFDLARGGVEVLPPDWWITVDQDGAVWRRCDVYILPAFTREQARRHRAPELLLPVGHLAGAGPDFVAYPLGKVQEIGEVSEIRYTRPDQGGKFHPYKGFASLARLVGGRGYRVRFRDGCSIDATGFRKP